MYAIVETAGQQVTVKPGDKVVLNRMDREIGTEVLLDRVLLVGGDALVVGTPTVAGASVTARVVSHDRGPKVVGLRYMHRRRYRVHRGFRADTTTLEILSIAR
jgi:large subunit ribosomal protein L21